MHGHSALYMTAALEGDLLRPLDPPAIPCLPGDMPDILKYKGKTNAAFTHLLINLALSAGGVWQQPHPRVLDPICGRGTTLYCALTRGMHAVGVEESRRELSEGIAFTQKWLQYHRVKHSMTRAGMTLPGGKNAPGTQFTVQTDTGALTMTMIQADTSQCGQLLRKQRVHALARRSALRRAARPNGRSPHKLAGAIIGACPARLVSGAASRLRSRRRL